MKRRPGYRNWWAPNVSTPRGLPLEFLVHFKEDFGELRISTALVPLLNLGGVRTGFVLTMLLPTEEELEVSIEGDESVARSQAR